MGTFANTNAWITGQKPVRTPSGPELCSQRFTLALGTADLDSADIGQVGWLPPGCVPVDVILDATDLDTSTAALIFDIGLMVAGASALSTAAADGGGKWGSSTASAVAFAGQRMTPYLNAINSVTPADTPRRLGLIVATPPTTAAAGTVGVTLIYRAA